MPHPEQPNIESEAPREPLNTTNPAPSTEAQRQEQIHVVESQKMKDAEKVIHAAEVKYAEEQLDTAFASKTTNPEIPNDTNEAEDAVGTKPNATPEQSKVPADDGLVKTLKTEGEAFMSKFNKAKGMEKIGIIMEQAAELWSKFSDSLLKIGGPALMQFANMAEKLNLFDKTWIDQIRALASSERAVLMEMLKSKNFVLVRDIDKQKDNIALGNLQDLYNKTAEIEAKKIPVAAAQAAPDATTPDAAPATTPAITPPKPTEVYTFKKYVENVVKEAVTNRNWDQKTANEEGVKQLTLTEIVAILPS